MAEEQNVRELIQEAQWWKKARKKWQVIESEDHIIGIYGLEPLEKAAGRVVYEHDGVQGPGWRASVQALEHDLKSTPSFHPEQGSNLYHAFREALSAVQGGFASVTDQTVRVEAKQREARGIVEGFVANIQERDSD